LCLALSGVLAQEYVPGEVLAAIPHDYLSLPEGETLATIDELSGHDSLLAVLSRSGVQTVVRLFPDAKIEDTLAIARDSTVIRVPDFSCIYRLVFPESLDAESVSTKLESSFAVCYAEPNHIYQCQADPDDDYFQDGSQWALNGVAGGVNAPSAWDAQTGSSSIRIGVFDTGIDYRHPDLGGSLGVKVIGGWNYWHGNSELNDEVYHGTHVAGIAAALTNNDAGIAGIAGGWGPNSVGCGVYSMVVANVQKKIHADWLSSAILDACGHLDLHVMNHSLGGYSFNRTVRLAMTKAFLQDRVTVASKGNDGYSTLFYPADYGDGGRGNIAMAVGASQQDGQRSPWSNWGNGIDLLAPGEQVLSTTPITSNERMEQETPPVSVRFARLSGTSMSAPHVAGAAALLLSQEPSLSVEDVTGVLRRSAVDIGSPGYDDENGYGRLNVGAALHLVKPPYIVEHLTAPGPNVWFVPEEYQAIDFERRAKSLLQLGWDVKPCEVWTEVTFPHEFVNPSVWGRHLGTTGWSRGDTVRGEPRKQYEEGWCDTVAGTLTSHGVRLRSYVYQVWRRMPWGREYVGFWPCEPGAVTFAYTVLGTRPVWQAMADVPVGPKGRRVKDGGCLAFNDKDDLNEVYALKGNGRCEFYMYSTLAGEWSTKETIPPYGSAGKRRPVKKGGCMAQTNGRMYAAKGNTSLEWWEYNPNPPVEPPTYPWSQKTDIPAGNNPVREGAGAVAVSFGGENYIFLLKGSNTQEFYRYNANANVWTTMMSAPEGESGKRFRNGSCLAHAPDKGVPGFGTVYALKGNYNELFAYNIATNAWTTKSPLPLTGSSGRRKKAKAGASLAYLDGSVYALKGGGTPEFWRYECDSDKWTQMEDMPPGIIRTVLGGGALVRAQDRLFAMKGHNTLEFYACFPNSQGLPPGQYQPTPPGPNEVLIAPGEVAQPRWDPLGQVVVYAKITEGQNQGIFKALVSGGGEFRLTPPAYDAFEPVVSPSGNQVAFLYWDPVSEHDQIGLVPIDGGPVTQLAPDMADHEELCWLPGTDSLLFLMPDTAGFMQVWLREASPTGTSVALTSSPVHHEGISARSSSQIVMTRDDDVGDYEQVYALTRDSLGWTETAVTSSPRDHSNPVVAGNGIAAFEVTDDNGVSQIGRVNVDSAGSEVVLTASPYDISSPTITDDARVIHATRHSGLGSSLCRVDPTGGGYTLITDDAADRDAPDITANNALCIVTSAYSREDGLYRTQGEPIPPTPLAEIAINPDHSGPVAMTATPAVVLKVLARDTLGWADSIKVRTERYLSFSDSQPVVSQGDWIGFDSLKVWLLEQGAGFYRFSIRSMFVAGGLDTSQVLQDSCIWDGASPAGAFQVNRGRRFCNMPICTLSIAGADTGLAGLGKMRNALKPFVNPVQVPYFDTILPCWQGNHWTYNAGLGLAEVQLAQDTLVWFYQDIPAETLGLLGAPGPHVQLAADVVVNNLQSPGNMEFRYCLVKNDTVPGPDTMWMPAANVPLPQGCHALVADSCLRTGFDFNPPCPPGYSFTSARLWFSFPNPPPNSGSILIDNVRLEPDAGQGYESSQFVDYDTLRTWTLGPIPGIKTVYCQLQDRAGSESETRLGNRPYAYIAPVSLVVDNIPPMACLSFPNPGQVITESLVSVEGLAYDPNLPPPDSNLSFFQQYKLSWCKAQGTGGQDTWYGILPESLFTEPMPPDTEQPGNPWRLLADWDAGTIRDSLGDGWYRLKLEVKDSADNNALAIVTVQLLTDSSSLDCMSGGSASGSMSITAGPEDDIYLGTSGGKLIQYTEQLDSLQAITLNDSAGAPVISGVSSDSTGAIYVSDLRARDLKCYDENGLLQERIGSQNQLTSPDDIAVAPNGDVWTVDRTNCVVKAYDNQGSLKRTFGSQGSDFGQFQGPTSIALSHPKPIPGDTTNTQRTPMLCFVCDKGNHRIQVFDTTGRYLSSFGTDDLAQPVAIAIDTNNCFYVADAQLHAILAYSPSGRHYLTIASTDTITPIATALSKDNGFIYAIDQAHNAIAKYTVLYTDTSVYGGGQSGSTNPNLGPRELMLFQSYPNPTTGRLSIRYGIPRATKATLKVYDITGKLTRTLINNQQAKPGYYTQVWNCRDNRNRRVAAGVYFYRLTADKTSKTRKLVVE
jgi:Tol biopolymer transport system component